MRLLVALLLSLPNIGAYAILAVGIVMIYRASKVLNLAHGAMAMIPPYVVYSLSEAGLPALVAIPVGIFAGGLLGYGVERAFIRPLRRIGTTAQTVGTVAALGILVAVAAKVWGTTVLPAVRVFPDGGINVSQSFIAYGNIGLFVVMLVVTGALLLLFQKTDIGLLMRGTAENRRAAALMGVDPDRITALAWFFGGALAGLSGVLLASVTNLHPYTLSFQALPAFVAALIAGLASLPMAVVGAALVGALGEVVKVLPGGTVEGAPQLVLAIVAIIVMARRGGRFQAGDVRAEGAVGGVAEAETKLRILEEGRRPLVLVGVGLFLAGAAFLPSSIVGNANRAAIFALVAVSLVLLTGWVGQISLGHAALVGIGAYGTGHLASGLGIPFPLNLPLAGLLAAAVATLLGIVAVRVRGLYLAVATLIFSWMADAFLFRQDWFTSNFRIDPRNIGQEGTLPFFDFTNRRVLYFAVWAAAGLAIYAAANMRDSKTGRAFFAVQGSEMAAASLGIDVVKYKLLAFSVSGFMAGVAGNLVMTEARALTIDQFATTWSFFYLAIAVVGGIASLGGAVAAGLLFASLDLLFFRVQALAGYLDIVSTGLLVVVLLAYPGGLARAGRGLVAWLDRREAVLEALRALDRGIGQFLDDLGWVGKLISRRARRRFELAGIVAPEELEAAQANGHRPVHTDGDATDPEATVELAPATLDLTSEAFEGLSIHDLGGTERLRPHLPPDRAHRSPILQAEEVTVRFGGLTAVNDVSLEVREGEIVGLIGPNGAGKSVTFNSIAGLVVPTQGRITLYGKDVTELPVHVRAQMGVARTFQAIQLFPQLSVFENLLVATHLHNPTGFLAHVAVTDEALRWERGSRDSVRRVVELLDLSDVAERRVADLPFGVLRMVEVARAMVTGFRFMMLDEPASGLDNTETDKLMDVLKFVRDLGVTLLLIEHDVKMVTSLSDYMYVLDRGNLIAEGTPDGVKNDPHVIAAYLGQQDEAEIPEEATV